MRAVFSLGFWHHVRIRPEEPLAIKVDHVVGVFGAPDVGFPGDVGEVGLHGFAVLEGGDEDQACFAACEQSLEFLASAGIHGAVVDDGLDEDEPVPGGVVEDEIGKPCVGGDGEAEGGQGFRIVMDALAFVIAEAEDDGAGIPAGAEYFDDRRHELRPSAFC